MSSIPGRRMKIGDFLLSRLQEAGVRHLFGVPGDYNLELLQQLQDTGTLKWIGTCGGRLCAAERPGRATGDKWRRRPERDQRCWRLLQRARAGHLHRRIHTAQVHRAPSGDAPHNGRREL